MRAVGHADAAVGWADLLAAAAVEAVGAPLGMSGLETAWAIHELVTLDMERAMRLISIDRGFDTRDFEMVCFGGAGPAHGSRLSRALGIRRLIVPSGAGVGSALGLLSSSESIEHAATYRLTLTDGASSDAVVSIFEHLERETRNLVWAKSAEGFSSHRA